MSVDLAEHDDQVRKPRTYRMPLTSQDDAIIRLPGVMTESDWNQMMAVLAAMKPGILSHALTGDSG